MSVWHWFTKQRFEPWSTFTTRKIFIY